MVKQSVVVLAALSVLAVGALVALVPACGGAPQKRAMIDPYSARVGQCVEGPLSSAAAPMIDIAEGDAILGSTEAERAQARRDYGPGGEALFRDEQPARRVRLRGFRLDRSPVNNHAYAEFVASCGVIPPDDESLPRGNWEDLRRFHGLTQPYEVVQRFLWQQGVPTPGRDQHPAVLVTHDQAAFYCAWRGTRLPTETEWERAARGPRGSTYPWGKAYDVHRVQGRARGTSDTAPVASAPEGNTREGFTDMGGHVWEWTSTPWRKRKGHFVVKGNGWDGRGGYGRGAARDSRAGEVVDVTLGFRCAADL